MTLEPSEEPDKNSCTVLLFFDILSQNYLSKQPKCPADILNCQRDIQQSHVMMWLLTK